MRNINKSTYIMAMVFGLVTLVVIMAVVYISSGSSTSAATSSSNSISSTTTNNISSSNFKDGSYKASINYTAHGNPESITVSVSLVKNIVTDVQNQESGNDSISAEYQSSFESNFKSLVVGKNINSISLSRIAGASDTTNAFMQALQQIQNDAKA